MLKVFLGLDDRQYVAYSVARFSIERRASKPTAVIPLRIEALPIKREGLTRFTWSRFLVPHLCDYHGWALFADSDFLFLCDIAELFSMADDRYAAMVVKNKEHFEWASMILFNCGHPANRILTPEYVETAKALHGLQWLSDDLIGELPKEYNCLVGYSEPRQAKIVHFTQGMPIFPETKGSPYTDEWRAEHKAMNSTLPWQETMGRSVHAAPTRDGRLVAKLHRDAVRGVESAMNGG
jgi:lipopolysaccharide biosynthesis glycosyltransferase